jgi:hypothetical protein
MNTLNQLIDDFLLTIQASGDVESVKTVQFNRRRIALFALFINEWKIDPLTPGAFRQYAVYLKTRKRLDGRPGGLSVYYRRGCLQTVKRFGHWLHQEGYADRDLGELITLPRLPKDAPLKAITAADIERMIGCCGLLRDWLASQISRARFSYLEGQQISITDAAKKYELTYQSIKNWLERGYIRDFGTDPEHARRILVNEADIAYTKEVLKLKRPLSGQSVF